MKFKLLYKDKKTKQKTWEEYDEPIEDAQKWAEETLQRFNDDLRPHEGFRKLLKVVILDEDSNEKHVWEKTNLVTISDKHGMYDTLKCKGCGVTAKRFGMNRIKIDSLYRAKAFRRCDTAKEALDKGDW